MKILHVSFSVVKRNPRVLNAVKVCQDLGWQTDVVSIKDGEETFKEKKNLSAHYFCPTGFIDFLPFRHAVFFAETFFFIRSRRNYYDVVFVHTMPDFLVFSALCPKLSGKKIVLSFSDMFPEISLEYRWGRYFFGFSLLLEKLAAKFSDLIFCVHEDHRELLKRSVSGKRVEYILNLPSPEMFENVKTPKEKHDNFQIFYAGSATKRFGLDVALDAFSKVLKVLPGVKFEILTGGRGVKSILKKIKNLKIEENVRMSPDFVSHKEAIKKLLVSDLALSPYRKTVFTDMVDSLKTLEYAASGVPFVCSEIDRMKKYFSGDECYFTRPGDSDSLAANIVQALQNYDSALEKAQNARAVIKKLSFEEQMVKYKKALCQIATTKSA
ncbi:glycosyltransferase [candidate division WOR-3 bacterium]|nr:glycosyltransferase [candidate division WOR-3 bacterium]